MDNQIREATRKRSFYITDGVYPALCESRVIRAQ